MLWFVRKKILKNLNYNPTTDSILYSALVRMPNTVVDVNEINAHTESTSLIDFAIGDLSLCFIAFARAYAFDSQSVKP